MTAATKAAESKKMRELAREPRISGDIELTEQELERVSGGGSSGGKGKPSVGTMNFTHLY